VSASDFHFVVPICTPSASGRPALNAESPIPDLVACEQFIRFWTEITGVGHLTLVAIVPDQKKTTARTFPVGDERAPVWVGTMQRNGCNMYFQPNETRPDCGSKPRKAQMVAALCRFADIDPEDERFPYIAERLRLAKLSEYLVGDPEYPPTVIIDSGNGMQPIWAVEREVLSPETINRIESETRAIESALGAGGTHNIDRLLRLPGTVNFPNRKKLSVGRGISQARLIFNAPNVVTIFQAGSLGSHLMGLAGVADLVRRKAERPERAQATTDDARVTALIGELRQAGVENIETMEDLPTDLHARLEAALKARPRLADRWAGMVDDLTERGLDDSRSGADFSLGAMLKRAGFGHLETGLILCVFPHGKTAGEEWPNVDSALRYVARCVLRSHEPRCDTGPDDEILGEQQATLNAVTDLIEDFNKRYMVVNEGGRALIYEPGIDPRTRRQIYTRITFEDFRKLHLNRTVRIGAKRKNAAEVWLEHRDRRQYLGGVIFDPSNLCVTDRMLNLWRGFAVQAQPGSWSKLRSHIRDVLCAGSQGNFDYLMGWMARLVQHPDLQGEVAVVLRGGEGTGKGTLAKVLLRILGQHGMAISNAKHLVGNFNGHLRDCVFLFADEAFFAGDRQHVGVLKSIITEGNLTIEAKFRDAVLMPNHVHLLMASNEEWVIPASVDARRFFVLAVLATHANDHEYFAAIWDEMDYGGYEALLHDLMNHDLTNFNVRAVPATDALQTQKKLSLGTSESWWMDVLYRGYVFESRLGLEDYFCVWHAEMSTEVLFSSYQTYAKGRHERHPMNRETFGRYMVNMVGAKSARLSNAVIGEHMTDAEETSMHGKRSVRTAELVKQPRPWGYVLGTLENARTAFAKATSLDGGWPTEADTSAGT
jgi:hypothetical protein